MPVWGWILIAVAVAAIAVVLVATFSMSRRKRTDRLRERFGPEYERTVFETGEQKAAEKELAARERNRAKLDIRPLTRGRSRGTQIVGARCRPRSSTTRRALWATRIGS